MSLFMILYTATGIGAVWGPLPYDLGECLRHRDEAMDELREKQRNHPAGGWTLGWRLECESHSIRPQITIDRSPDLP